MSYPKRLYHPELGVEIVAGDEGQEAVYAESGWKPAPDPPAARPGYAAEPLVYEQGDDGIYRPVVPEVETEHVVKGERVARAERKRTSKPTEDS